MTIVTFVKCVIMEYCQARQRAFGYAIIVMLERPPLRPRPRHVSLWTLLMTRLLSFRTREARS